MSCFTCWRISFISSNWMQWSSTKVNAEMCMWHSSQVFDDVLHQNLGPSTDSTKWWQSFVSTWRWSCMHLHERCLTCSAWSVPITDRMGLHIEAFPDMKIRYEHLFEEISLQHTVKRWVLSSTTSGVFNWFDWSSIHALLWPLMNDEACSCLCEHKKNDECMWICTYLNQKWLFAHLCGKEKTRAIVNQDFVETFTERGDNEETKKNANLNHEKNWENIETMLTLQ